MWKKTCYRHYSTVRSVLQQSSWHITNPDPVSKSTLELLLKRLLDLDHITFTAWDDDAHERLVIRPETFHCFLHLQRKIAGLVSNNSHCQMHNGARPFNYILITIISEGRKGKGNDLETWLVIGIALLIGLHGGTWSRESISAALRYFSVPKSGLLCNFFLLFRDHKTNPLGPLYIWQSSRRSRQGRSHRSLEGHQS